MFDWVVVSINPMPRRSGIHRGSFIGGSVRRDVHVGMSQTIVIGRPWSSMDAKTIDFPSDEIAGRPIDGKSVIGAADPPSIGMT